MFNPERGEAVIEIDGAAHALRFTLGALAEIEHALKAAGPDDLGARLKQLDAAGLQAVLAALLRAGGAEAPDQLAAKAGPRQAAQAVAACLKANLT